MNIIFQKLKEPKKLKVFWCSVFAVIWLGTNAYAISQTPEWSSKFIVAFILGNLCMFIAAAYMVFVYRATKKIGQLDQPKIHGFYKKSMWILGLVLLVVPFFFMIHVPDSAHFWDFFQIFSYTSITHGGSFTRLHGDDLIYFLQYSNNQFFGVVYNFFFGGLGTTAKIWVLTAVSAVFTSGAVLAASLLVKKISSEKMALIFNLVAFGFLPFYVYGAQFYTDTASLPFVMFGLLFMVYAVKSERTLKMVLWWIAACVVVFIGYNIKPTVFIPMIAVFIFLLLNRKWKQLVIMVPIAAVMFLGVHEGVKATVQTQPVFSQANADRYQLPMVHWVAMSMDPDNKWGGFNPKVLAYSQSFTTKEAKTQGDIQLLTSNLKKQGVGGVLLQLWRKINYTWFNGDLSDFFYTYRHANPFLFRYFDWTSFAPSEGNIMGWILIKAAQTLYWIAIVPLMFYEMFLSIFKKHKTEWFILGLGMLGLTAFLLVWEANSRYLYNFAPIILALATMGLVDFLNRKARGQHEISK